MRTWRTRKVGLSTAALTAGIVLVGCSGGNGGTAKGEQRSPASSTAASTAASTAKVADTALGKALDKLAFQGAGRSGEGSGACLGSAVRKAGMSEKALAYIVKADSDDMGTVIGGLNKVSGDDAALLASRSLREDFDGCVSKAVLSDSGSPKAQSYTPPEAAAKPVVGKPNLKPAYPVRAEQPVSSSIELTKGLVSMFSSFARDESQKKTYAAAGPCLATSVYKAGFSQETLHFLAGGAPLGTGSIVEHVPNDKDKAIWQSPRFTQELVDCTANATPTPLSEP